MVNILSEFGGMGMLFLKQETKDRDADISLLICSQPIPILPDRQAQDTWQTYSYWLNIRGSQPSILRHWFAILDLMWEHCLGQGLVQLSAF